LREKSGEISEVLADCKAQLKAQVPRIQELRMKKAEDPLAFFGGDAIHSAESDIPDNVSITPTNASTAGGQSLFTRYSNASRMTSKTRRREERKRARGKKGSVYEEEYLVNSVKRLVEKVNNVQMEAGRVVEGLLVRGLGLRQLAEALDESVKEIIGMCREASADVWGISESVLADSAKERPSGADGVFWESQQGAADRTPPELRAWAAIPLLEKRVTNPASDHNGLDPGFYLFNLQTPPSSSPTARLPVLAPTTQHNRQVAHTRRCRWMLFAQHRPPQAECLPKHLPRLLVLALIAQDIR
jgi:elongator complex protein 1